MKLSFHTVENESQSVRARYPSGYYWYAATDSGDYDAEGPDPLTAVSALVVTMEKGEQ